MLHWELKILFSILSCSATEQWGAAPWVTSYTAQAIFPISFSNTRKILGAFYVDQKKKDLPPSTLPSEHKQWGYSSSKSKTWNQTLPLAMNDINYTAVATLIGSGNGNYDVVKIMNISTLTLGFNIETANTEGAGVRFIVIGN